MITAVIGSGLSFVMAASAGTSASDNGQLHTFQSWAHSPATAAVMLVGYAILVALVFTPLGPKLFRRPPSGTWRAVVVVLGVLGLLSWVSSNWWFTTLMMVALWGCAVWLIVRGLGSAVSGVERLATELDPEKRAELQREQAAAAERGAALERVLDEAEEDRR